MESTKTIEPGSVVRLKSGGPDMTVKTLGPLASEITCIWFGVGSDGHYTSGAPLAAAFPAVGLKPV